MFPRAELLRNATFTLPFFKKLKERLSYVDTGNSLYFVGKRRARNSRVGSNTKGGYFFFFFK